MAQEIEIEFKTRLKAEDFYVLKNALAFNDKPIDQVNHYFETKDEQLKKAHCALRIREINGKYMLTLKQPLEEGLLETNEEISKLDAKKWLKNQATTTQEVTDILTEQGINIKELQYFGQLKTERYLFKTNNLEYVIDHSFYLDQEDYEVEIEATSYDVGEAAFDNLIEKFNLSKEIPVSKIERFMTAYHKKLQKNK